MSSPKAPKTPDYAKAAIAQGHISNPDIYTPGGSQEVTWKGNNPTIRQTLSPEQQALYDQKTQQQQGLSNLGLLNVGNLQDVYSDSFNEDGSLDRQRVEDSLYNRSVSRLDPQFQRQEDQLRTRLTNQGLNPNDEAWQNELKDFNNSRNDAYEGARTQSVLQGGTAQQQALAAALQMRQQPLQEQAQLMSLSQGQMPEFQPYQAPDYQGAFNNQSNFQLGKYNADSAQYSNNQNGLLTLGALGTAALMMSDRRLKKDIVFLENIDGFNIYSFKYIWDEKEQIGVMADEVEKILPEAVKTVRGYKMVNYGMLPWIH